MAKTVTVQTKHALTICLKPGKPKTQTSPAVPAELKRLEPGTITTMDADEAEKLAGIGALVITASSDDEDEKAAKKAAAEAKKAAAAEAKKAAAAEKKAAAKTEAPEGDDKGGDDKGDDDGKNLV